VNILFSVIIPARNAENTIGKCLYSLRQMTYPTDKYEIVVVDDGSRDRTSQIAREFGARVIKERCTSIAAVRNLGARYAQGKILAHLDSDMVVDKRWLDKAEQYFENGFTGALHFVDDVPEEARWLGRLWSGPFRQSKDGVRKAYHLPSSNLLVNKKLHDLYGGFDEDLFSGRKGGSDREYTYRIYREGHSVISDSSLEILHLGYERSLTAFLKKEWWHQGNSIFIARKHQYPLLLLKNPFLSFFHLLCFIILSISLVFTFKFSYLFFFVWITPSFLLLIKRMNIQKYWKYLPTLWVLTFLRWNIAGFALLPQLFYLTTNPRRGRIKSDPESRKFSAKV